MAVVRLADLTFEHWLEHVFSHEVRFQRPAWFFDADHDWWDPKPVVAVGYLTRLFEDAETALRYFSDSQIAQGLTYLVSTSASGDNGWLYSQMCDLRSGCAASRPWLRFLFKYLFLVARRTYLI